VDRHLFWAPCCHDLSPLVSALRAQVDDPVGCLDDLQVVLDHDDCVAGIGQAVQDMKELADVVEVQPSGRFVQGTGFGRCSVCSTPWKASPAAPRRPRASWLTVPA
jgi:hypothetical protein